MAAHELHVCATFSRQFYWTELNLWPEDLVPGSVVLLSGRDDLMNAQQVKTMLEQAGHVKVGVQACGCSLCIAAPGGMLAAADAAQGLLELPVVCLQAITPARHARLHMFCAPPPHACGRMPQVHYNRDLTHGEFLIKSEVKQAIMEEVRAMLARSGSAVVGLARPVLATTMTLAYNALGVGGVVRLQRAGGGAK